MTSLTLLGHSAVALRNDSATLVIDPGVFSDLGDLADADAVLVTHGDPDHVAAAALVGVLAPIWAPAEVIAQLAQAGVPDERLQVVAPGDTFEAAGFAVVVGGGEHGEIYPGLPGAANNTYLVDGRILHTGDSLPEVDDSVEVLLLPVAAPWLKIADSIGVAKAAPAARVFPLHDGILSDGGRMLTDNILTAVLGAEHYTRPAAGEAVQL